MSSVTESAGVATFDAALLAACDRAKAFYPAERPRIERGLAIVVAGGVDLLPDGTALVASSQGGYYKVNGQCTCADYANAPEGRCKHRWAKSLHKAALIHQIRYLPPERYWATYYAPDGEAIPGTAEYDKRKQCWLFTPEDGQEPLYAATQALCLGGQIDLAEKQADADGELALKFAVPQYVQVDLDAAKAELAAIKAKRESRTWGL